MFPTNEDAWYHCPKCATGQGFLSSMVSSLTPEYVYTLAKVPPILLQGLSCVDSAMQIQQKFRAFATGEAAPNSFLTSPIVSNAIVHAKAQQVHSMHKILAHCVLHNPVIQKFQTLWEMTDFLFDTPILGSAVTEDFMKQVRIRGPLNDLQEKVYQDQPISLMRDLTQLPDVSRQFWRLFNVGRAVACGVPGQVQLLMSDVSGILRSTRLTLEASMYPHMFPDPSKVFNAAHNLDA